jgi:hypothetical protein
VRATARSLWWHAQGAGLASKLALPSLPHLDCPHNTRLDSLHTGCPSPDFVAALPRGAVWVTMSKRVDSVNCWDPEKRSALQGPPPGHHLHSQRGRHRHPLGSQSPGGATRTTLVKALPWLLPALTRLLVTLLLLFAVVALSPCLCHAARRRPRCYTWPVWPIGRSH